MFDYKEDTPEFIDLEVKSFRGLRFYQTPEGVYLPSVTTILSSKDKPWLDNWRNMLGDKKAQKETERCAARGTAVHLMCENYLKNQPIEEVIADQPREYVKLFNQIKLALNNKVSNIRAQEIALWDEKIGAAGRVDLVADYKGVPSIIDFKTSNNNKTEDMIEDYFIQCTAYALMYFYRYGELIEDIVVIITVEKGMMPLVYKKKIDDYVAPLLQQISDFMDAKGDVVEKANAEL
jgi:hypothetical protein